MKKISLFVCVRVNGQKNIFYDFLLSRPLSKKHEYPGTGIYKCAGCGEDLYK